MSLKNVNLLIKEVLLYLWFNVPQFFHIVLRLSAKFKLVMDNRELILFLIVHI